MIHPGLSAEWTWLVVASMLAVVYRVFLSLPTATMSGYSVSFTKLPLLGPLFRYLVSQTNVLLLLKLVFLALFTLVIVAGLWGSPIAERNLGTVLTWNFWWTGVIISILFFGTSWCAVCPWDTMANLLVRRSLWRKAVDPIRLNFTVPPVFRNLWPALTLLTFFTWLELGIGVADDPYATACLALLMVVLATVALVVYEDKAFCRYFCPVGRTIGVYAQLSSVALRPIDVAVCESCSTLDCYHGNARIDPCPTKLVMGRLQESTYCISCGNCTQSCPSNNINWQLRSPSVEAIQDARPHLDEACFMIGLLGLTTFHGVTMLPAWPAMISQLARLDAARLIAARLIGDGGQLIMTFTIAMLSYLLLTFIVYASFAYAFGLVARKFDFRQVFSGFAFASLPVAFTYHVAHNLNHLLRESGNMRQVFLNPLGLNALPLSMAEKHQRTMEMLVSSDAIAGMQVALVIFGFWLSMQVVKHRGAQIFAATRVQLLPVIAFCVLITVGSLWLLSQPMAMRM